MNVKIIKPNSIKNLDAIFKNSVQNGLSILSKKIGGNPNSKIGGIIKNEMNKPKTGIIYPKIVIRKKVYYNHQASNSNGKESSAILTGKLAKSIKATVIGSNQLEISAETPYARIQEYGGERVKARQNIFNPIKKFNGNIKKDIMLLISSNLK